MRRSLISIGLVINNALNEKLNSVINKEPIFCLTYKRESGNIVHVVL